MNIELISRITGKEYYIIDLIIKLIGEDIDVFEPDKTVTYRDGRYSKIFITCKSPHNVSKNVFKEFKDTITIIDSFGSFNNAELNINSELINLYKNYKFTIKIADKFIFKIDANLIDTEQVPTSGDNRLSLIKNMFNKIKSIELVDKNIFKSNTVILKDWNINVLFNRAGGTKIDLTEVVYIGIRKMYSDGMIKISPMDSDSK